MSDSIDKAIKAAHADIKAAHGIIKRSHWLMWAIAAVVVLDFITGAWFGAQF